MSKMKKNWRMQYISDNIKFCKDNWDEMDDWCKEFVTSIEKQVDSNMDLTSNQYNKLVEVVARIKGIW